MVVGKIYRPILSITIYESHHPRDNNLKTYGLMFDSFVVCLSLIYEGDWVTVKVLTEKGIIGFFTTTYSTLSVLFEEL